jgi:glycosyltransferase involved in cell wall biosynthesis
MRILFVGPPSLEDIGGIRRQLLFVAQELGAKHSVEIVTTRQFDKEWRQNCVVRRLLRFATAVRLSVLLRKVRGWIHAPDDLARAEGQVATHCVSHSIIDHLIRWTDPRGHQSDLEEKLRALVRGKDVVHSMKKSVLGVTAEKVARTEGIPFLLTPFLHPKGVSHDARHVWFYRKADRVFALIDSDAQKLVELGVPPDKIRFMGVVPLLPETPDPDGFRARHSFAGKPVVLFVGRVNRSKGVPSILEATHRVWARIPDARFVFAGPANREAKRWFYNCDPRIRYLGVITDQEKGDAMAACDLFCMPSEGEILPAVYLEAWSYAKPVIGGIAHGLKELIEGNQAGVVVDQDPGLLASTIVDLLSDEPRRRKMGTNGQALVRSRYSKEALVRALEGVYREVCRSRAEHRQDPLSANTE